MGGEIVHAHGGDGQEEQVTVVHGQVLNAVTNEPVGRALVNLQIANSATLTDDRGWFELKISEKRDAQNGRTAMMMATRFIQVRKPGFIQGGRMATSVYPAGSTTEQQTTVTIRLEPEALIIGHVEVPGSEGEVRIQCQLYHRNMSEGRESWAPERTFTTWANGEFRFSDLKAGTYKLITHEQMDRGSMMPGTGPYGYPPIYYPNTTDFSAAAPIVVKAGETARVNLTVTRQEYHSVKIAVANMPVGQFPQLLVYPMGHRSPGWSLGYDPGEGEILGSLPDGSYTVEANTQGGKAKRSPS
jgi:hypothetical protein